MSTALSAATDEVVRIDHDCAPVLGGWYWVPTAKDGWDEKNGTMERLLCCVHIGSNHADFNCHCGDWYSSFTIHDSRYIELRKETGWLAIMESRIAEAQDELRREIIALQDKVQRMSLHGQEGTSMALAVCNDPIAEKLALIEFRETGMPAVKKRIDAITTRIVGLQKNLYYRESLAAQSMLGSVEAVNQRIFALELYAGIDEGLHLIRDGSAPEAETPITIFQGMRYMDEETLIDAVDGGMDFKSMDKFDMWAADNIETITAGHERAVIAWKVRRHGKDYGTVGSLSDAFRQCEWHERNKFTYLLIRNGQRVYRYWSAIEFHPRLIPLRGEFSKPLLRENRSHPTFRGPAFGTRVEENEVVTTDDMDYDDKLKERNVAIRHYNRILYVIQGLLDRTKAFSPHPPIMLSDSHHVALWVVMKHDEEDTLPNGNPPSWEDYRNACNAKLRVGDVVYCQFEYKTNPRSWRDKSEWREYNGFMRVSRLEKEGKIMVVDSPGTRYGYEHQTYGEWGEWPKKKRDHHEIKITEAFNVAAYAQGDYKQFLCDPALKGQYLRWAPFLLSAEKAAKMTAEEMNKEAPPLKA